MNVSFRVGGQVVVDDVGDALDIQSAGGDIGGNEDVEDPFFELLDGPFALVLCDITVEGYGRIAMLAQVVGDFDGPQFGLHENDHAVEILGLDDSGQGFEFHARFDDEEALTDVISGLLPRGDLDHLGGFQVLVGDLSNLIGHRGRE